VWVKALVKRAHHAAMPVNGKKQGRLGMIHEGLGLAHRPNKSHICHQQWSGRTVMPMTESDTRPQAAQVAMTQHHVPHQYFNGFELNGTLSDFGLTLMIDGQPVSRLAMSFTTAKTLVQKLQGAIDLFENVTGNKLMIMDDVARSYDEASKK
jgi:hypothetical protein